MNHFKETSTSTDENGYTYFNTTEDPTDEEIQMCTSTLIHTVQKYKTS
jgi:hypothetical protein